MKRRSDQVNKRLHSLSSSPHVEGLGKYFGGKRRMCRVNESQSNKKNTGLPLICRQNRLRRPGCFSGHSFEVWSQLASFANILERMSNSSTHLYRGPQSFWKEIKPVWWNHKSLFLSLPLFLLFICAFENRWHERRVLPQHPMEPCSCVITYAITAATLFAQFWQF